MFYKDTGKSCTVKALGPPEIIMFHLEIQTVITVSLLLVVFQCLSLINVCKISETKGAYIFRSHVPQSYRSQLASYCLPANATCLNLRSILLELQWPEISQYFVRFISSSWSTYNRLCGQETLSSIMWETKLRANVDFSHEKKYSASDVGCLVIWVGGRIMNIERENLPYVGPTVLYNSSSREMVRKRCMLTPFSMSNFTKSTLSNTSASSIACSREPTCKASD